MNELADTIRALVPFIVMGIVALSIGRGQR